MDDSLPEPPASAPTPSQEASQPQSQSQSEPELAETVTVSDGRRRGRRRVMKKKTVRDEEGYLGSSLMPMLKLASERALLIL